MTTSYGALCTDFYINQKLALKMDLPTERETLLHFFDQVRKTRPGMTRFRRYEDELSLESSRREAEYTWLSLRQSSIRTGHVNPQSMEDAYAFHSKILEIAPYYLTLSPLDIDYLELVFGFDLECTGNHDDVIFEALIASSPMGELMRPTDSTPNAKILDVQPVFGMNLTEDGQMQAYFEVKSRRRSRRGSGKRYREEPISIFVTVRGYGPTEKLDDLPAACAALAEQCETLVNERLIPNLLNPIVQHITPSSR